MIRRFRCPVCQCYIGRRDGQLREHIDGTMSSNNLRTWICKGSGTPATEQYQETS